MNLRYSARSFLRSPGLTLVLLLSIAAGVGSNAAVHAFAHGLTAPRLRHPVPQGVVSIFARESPGGELSYEDIAAIERSGAFAWVGAVRQTQGTLLADRRSVIVSVAAVTPPVAGLFDFPLDDGAVVGYRLWQLELDASSEIRGDAIRVDGVNLRVSGVAPEPLEGLYAGQEVDVWTTLRADALDDGERTSRSFWALGRLHPGVKEDEAEALIRTARPAGEIAVVPYTGVMRDVADGMSRVGTLLRLAAGAVLLIACANVASFLLGRAAARSHEISLRVALGAGRRDLMAQLLVDSALVALAGGAAGALLGLWTSRIVPALFFERDARELMFSPDPRGTLIAAAACVVLLVACGLAPLLEARHDRPAAVLQREGVGPSPSGRRLRAFLVVAQIGASFVLAISAVLLVQGLQQALQTAVRHRMDAPIVATVFANPGYELPYFRNVEEAALSAPASPGRRGPHGCRAVRRHGSRCE
jgi:putative ABC transport system permease protein